MKLAQTNLSKLAETRPVVASACAGARASARFNVQCGVTQEMSGPLPIRELKRRERRAPNENSVQQMNLPAARAAGF
jgi:hypothetical protein